ncbi:MAG: response regulator [Gallionella sp.]|nr:response regulator [Gallionella sp.]
MNFLRYNVLLIEDDLSAIDLAHRAASDCCAELDLTVAEGVDAVLKWLDDSIESKRQMPHFIMLDLKLPKLDGLAILRKLRIHPATRDVPVVTFSAEHTQADVLMAYQVGANSFVAKPVDLAQFTGFFREQLAYWMQPRQRDLVFSMR